MTDTREGPPAKAATSADVARLAGVSRSTVSFVLNNAPQPITEATRDNVLRAAQMLNYRPNLAAKSLAEGTSRVILIDLGAAAWSGPTVQVNAELTASLADHGYVAAIHLDTPERPSLITTALRIRPRSVLLSRDLTPSEQDQLNAAGIATVRIPTAGLVDMEAPAAELRLRHLQQRGHRRIAIVERDDRTQKPAIEARRRALLKAASELGLEEPPILLLESSAESSEEIRRLIDKGVTGVCAFNDDAALAFIRAAADAGLACPGDVAVIGADDTFAGSVAFPPLTSISADVGALGALLAPVVLATLGIVEPPAPFDTRGIIRLVVRSST